MKNLLTIIVLVSLLLIACKKDTLPEVETLPASIEDATHVNLHGKVIAEGSTAVMTRGFCWALTTNPTVSDNLSQNEFGPGEFVEELLVIPDTTYFIKAYARNNKGTSYGNEVVINTNSVLPKIETIGISEITTSSAQGGGNITADGGLSIIARGICWSASQSPTLGNSKTNDGEGKGLFVSTLSDLLPNKTYYVRAFATNSARTAYGNEVVFKTLIGLPVITTSPVTNITEKSATGGGTVTNDGGSNISARGVCWSEFENPTTADNRTLDGTGLGTFISKLTGLTYNTIYHIRAYATNSEDIVYGSDISFKTNLDVLFTGVSGTCSFLAGTAGDLSNSKVSLYSTLDNWNNNSPIKFGAVTGNGASVTYRLTANPGNYYLDIWKDNDNNGFWSALDFIGWYGSGGLGSPALTEIQLQQAQNFQSNITMYIF